MTPPRHSPRRQYPHLRGDLDTSPLLLSRLDALAAKMGTVFDITSGGRTLSEQAALYANRGSNPYPVAPPSRNSPHIERVAADVLVGGKPIQEAISAATLKRFGIEPLSGDAVHVQLAGTVGKTAAQLKHMHLGESKFPWGPAERKRVEELAQHEGLKSGFSDVVPGVDKGLSLADQVISGIFGEIHPEALMLNVALIGGGAFLIYYGGALMLGVRKPVAAPAKAAAKVAAVAK